MSALKLRILVVLMATCLVICVQIETTMDAEQSTEVAKQGDTIYTFLAIFSLLMTMFVVLSTQFVMMVSAEEVPFSPEELAAIVDVKVIGRGSQGIVFKVTTEDDVYALKMFNGCGNTVTDFWLTEILCLSGSNSTKKIY